MQRSFRVALESAFGPCKFEQARSAHQLVAITPRSATYKKLIAHSPSITPSLFLHPSSITYCHAQPTNDSHLFNKPNLISQPLSTHQSKCPQRPQLRLLPLVARPQLARLLLRRRRLARRPLRHQARRRSAPRPARRPTLHTSTRVSFHRIPAVSDSERTHC